MNLGRHFTRLDRCTPLLMIGRVKRATGLIIEAEGPVASIGEDCEIISGERRFPVEIVGFRDQMILAMPLGRMVGIQAGDRLISRRRLPAVPVGPELLGRVIDATGEPLDGRGTVATEEERDLTAEPLNPLSRVEISEVLGSGVRAIDACLTLGRGQRVGLFGGSGVGKSTLLAMMARYTSADVNVIAMVGERGREVRSFIEKDLGDGIARSVVVVATSEHSPLLRVRAALMATAIAEYFRDRGQQVLLMMDSLTRFAMAQREIGLATGEPPSTKGYTPSVFNILPALVERAGRFSSGGSITGLYTVLVEGDDMADPIADSARSLLDGHIVLSRRLAERGHFPSIDLPASLSRLMPDLVKGRHFELASRVRNHLAVLGEVDDLLAIGAYSPGTNPAVDRALARREAVDGFLRQKLEEPAAFAQVVPALEAALGEASS